MLLIIPFFIPHMGCPHQCLFCNQHSITGVSSSEDSAVVELVKVINEWLPRRKGDQEVQLAFYGGSFTCLKVQTQERLLSTVAPYIKNNNIKNIRLSTRPDCIDDSICILLKKYGVTTVELGVQSMNNTGLLNSKRGHGVEDSVHAIKTLKKHGFRVGVQLLPGLPGETFMTFLRGVQSIIELQPQMIRLYPAIVVKGAELEKLYDNKEYKPLSLNKAIAWITRIKPLLDKAGITIIRMGLQHSTSLSEQFVAGPHHPAFGELVSSRILFNRVRKKLSSCPNDEKIVVKISEKDLSMFYGPKKLNLSRLKQLGLENKMVLRTDKKQERGTIQYAVSE